MSLKENIIFLNLYYYPWALEQKFILIKCTHTHSQRNTSNPFDEYEIINNLRVYKKISNDCGKFINWDYYFCVSEIQQQ